MSNPKQTLGGVDEDIRRASIINNITRRESFPVSYEGARKDSEAYNNVVRRESVPYTLPLSILQNGFQGKSDGVTSSTHNEKSDVILNGSMFRNQAKKSQETVVVVGTGDLGRALVSCLVRAGYRAVVASRNPEKNRLKIAEIGGFVYDFQHAVSQSEIILVAIPYGSFETLPPTLLEGKIVIDVSNRPVNVDLKGQCLAINLQKLLPNSKVVKAFNTLSAYALQKGLTQGSKEVPVCSDYDDAKATVINLARNLGFVPVDYGSLTNAIDVENIPLAFFKDWKFGAIFGITVWSIAFTLQFFRSQLCKNFASDEWDWSLFAKLPSSTVHKSFAQTAITSLAACYFPGVIASYLQLYRGTKYSIFPQWLDSWLKSRKQLGLLALLLASMHCILVIFGKISYGMMNTWRESTYLTAGTFSLTLMAILGVTSLPSVSASLTWREFSFVQRYLGWFSLGCGTIHIIFVEWNHLIENELMCIFLPSGPQIAIILPVVTIVLKLPLLLPCVDNYIQKIRRGYERVSTENPA